MSNSQHTQSDGRLSRVAIIQMLGSGMSFALMNGVIKWLGQRYDVPTIFFWRSAAAFLIVLPLLTFGGGFERLRTGRLAGHSLRAIFGVAGTLCFSWTVTQLPLGTAVTLAYAWPVFMVGIAVWVLHEPASWTQAVLALLGFSGVVLICGFSWSAPGPGIVAGLASALLFACAYAAMKWVAKTENPVAISFYYNVSATFVGFALSVPHWTWPAWSDVPALVAAGILGGSAQCLVASAFKRANASQLASYDYATIVWSLVIGWAVWAEIPNVAGLAGTLLIAASGIAMARMREPARDISGDASGRAPGMPAKLLQADEA